MPLLCSHSRAARSRTADIDILRRRASRSRPVLMSDDTRQLYTSVFMHYIVVHFATSFKLATCHLRFAGVVGKWPPHSPLRRRDPHQQKTQNLLEPLSGPGLRSFDSQSISQMLGKLVGKCSPSTLKIPIRTPYTYEDTPSSYTIFPPGRLGRL